MPWPGSDENADVAAGDPGTTPAFATELKIEVERAAGAKLSGRLASVPLTEQGGLVHLRVEAAHRLSSLPAQASLVILVDQSHSVEEKDRDAGIAAVGQVLRRLPGARVAVLGFDRRVRPLYSGFRVVPAAADALEAAEFTAGNGSAVDEALAAANRLVAREKGERRIYLLSDLLTRTRLEVSALAPIAKGAVLHIGNVTEGEPTLEPQQQGPWAKLARASGGLCWNGHARADGIEGSAVAEVYEEWVRPTRLYNFAVDGLSALALARNQADPDVVGLDTATPPELREGTAFDYFGLPFQHPRRVSVRGELWSRPVSLQVESTPAEARLWSALIFGDGLYNELSPREMMTLAMRGRAVSPVTSYLAIEPGVRPSTEGLEDGHGSGGGGTGEGTMGLGSFSSIGKGGGWDPEKLLREMLGHARGACRAAKAKVTARIETTYREIVDVPEVEVEGEGDAACIREAIWSWALPGEFSDERADYTFGLPPARS
jgi:hypothetical protein